MSQRKPFTLTLSIGLLASALAGNTCCTGPEHSTGPEPSTIVLITIDTWRSDASGFLGGRYPSPTPFLDTLSERGLVASRAVAPVPLTGPSHWSMITGRWPWLHGVRVNGDIAQLGTDRTLAEHLSRAGWQTGGFVSCTVLDHRLGFGKGFDVFDDKILATGSLDGEYLPERSGAETVDLAVDWLHETEIDRNLFLWVHLFEPHFPYVGERDQTPFERYLSEVSTADSLIQGLAENIEAVGRGSESISWFVLSDHGEAFGAHGEATHGFLLHSVTTQIPLLIAGPGVVPGRLDRLVSTVDIFPTVLATAGLQTSDNNGQDLLSSELDQDRAIPLESMLGLHSFGVSSAVGLRSEKWLWESSPADHLWDLVSDPSEDHDLALSEPDVVLEHRLLREEFHIPSMDCDRRRDLPKDLARSLEALGYLEKVDGSWEGDLRDFTVNGAALHSEIISLQKSLRYSEAEVKLREFLFRYPNSPFMWHWGGLISVGLGDLGEAEMRFSKALEMDPSLGAARLNLGNICWMQKRLEEAVAEYERVLENDPEDLYALYNLGSVYVEMNRDNEAVGFWKRFVELYPGHPNAAGVRQSLARISVGPGL